MNFNLFSKSKHIIKLLLKELLDLLYKRKCIVCGCSIQGDILCKTCAKTVENISCFAQGKINGYNLYSAFYYKDVIRTLIHELKFKHNKVCALYAAKYLADFLEKVKEYEKDNIDFSNAVIIPVLTHKTNKNKRGYDNVYEIAKKLSDLSGYTLNATSLKRIKFTRPQFELNKTQRKENIKGSFKLDENFKANSLVILLDDIVTTGSTLEFITSLFKERGINNLICLTLAKAEYKKSFKKF